MKRKLTYLFLIGFLFFSYAQNRGNIWYFGFNAGIEFNGGGVPQVLTDGKLYTKEGCASIKHMAYPKGAEQAVEIRNRLCPTAEGGWQMQP
jgi:hypothetical protein